MHADLRIYDNIIKLVHCDAYFVCFFNIVLLLQSQRLKQKILFLVKFATMAMSAGFAHLNSIRISLWLVWNCCTSQSSKQNKPELVVYITFGAIRLPDNIQLKLKHALFCFHKQIQVSLNEGTSADLHTLSGRNYLSILQMEGSYTVINILPARNIIQNIYRSLFYTTNIYVFLYTCIIMFIQETRTIL